ncbi:CCR4-NOT transcription complex subunit 1 isoform X1 [Tanacetum coccineum]
MQQVDISFSKCVNDHDDRASMEPNFHMLYIDFVEKINSKHLNKELVEASYQNCKVLLKSPLIKSSDKERKLLKNLGGWTWKITICQMFVQESRNRERSGYIPVKFLYCPSSSMENVQKKIDDDFVRDGYINEYSSFLLMVMGQLGKIGFSLDDIADKESSA